MPGGTGRQQVRTLTLRGGGPGTLAGMNRRVVFGTLLGPETTGPGGFFLSGTCVSGFLAAPITRLFPFVGRVWGVWYGVVV